MSILTTLLTALGIPVLADGIILMCNQASNIGVYLTIILGVILIFTGLCLKLIKKLFIYPLFKLASTLVCVALVIVCVVSSFLFVYGNSDTVTYNEDYLLVLGCGLNGSEPSQTLTARLDEAVKYANRNESCRIIVSGGQGNGEDIPEAEAMASYLIDCGIEPERIIKEPYATSTSENIEFSDKVTDGNLQSSSAAFVTSDFHVYRANSLAKMQGFSMTHLGAKTELHNVIPSYLRENLALIQMIVFNK